MNSGVMALGWRCWKLTDAVLYRRDAADLGQIAGHLQRCDARFVPRLSARVDLDEYAQKIFERAERFEAWSEGSLVGLVAAYCNDAARGMAFITSVSVLGDWGGRGIGTRLLRDCVTYAKLKAFRTISLEVGVSQRAAIRMYERCGFAAGETRGVFLVMHLDLDGAVPMGVRDYNREMQDSAERRYAYGFDFDVMHPFMIRSFEPFFRRGSLLELGSFKGDFTRRLLPFFSDITCVEASDEALAAARERAGSGVRWVHSSFEAAELPQRYDHIVLTHVLEHLDDPVGLLRRINTQWLAEGGRLFLVCPNANAPSRQIAVKMGLISHNSAVTEAEAAHGHRRTYDLDTLEHDAVSAGLRVAHRSGIFFKALANFQWDRLLQTDIVSPEYLEGCYQLGKQYPDLCASIFLLCEGGTAARAAES
jgi:ribosomal protein S18 acetylase RimI-like enzyme/SAM-dependent methyltransferase